MLSGPSPDYVSAPWRFSGYALAGAGRPNVWLDLARLDLIWRDSTRALFSRLPLLSTPLLPASSQVDLVFGNRFPIKPQRSYIVAY